MSYVNGLVPEHESLERLSFRASGGSDQFYEIPSSFSSAQAKRGSPSTARTERFGKTGFETGLTTPGPGTYTSTVDSSSKATFVKSPQRRQSPARGPEESRIDFPSFEGADNFYTTPSSFKKAASKSPTPDRLAKAQRFGKTGFEKGSGTPGPGSYSKSNSPLDVRVPKSPKRPTSARNGSGERLKFQSTEGADNYYKVKSSFEKATPRSPSRTTSKTERFGPTGFERGVQTPGPGSYNGAASLNDGTKVFSAKGSPKVCKSQSTDVIPVDEGRLQFKQSEGADAYYQTRSSFRDTGTVIPQTDRFGKTGFEKGVHTPGPGSYGKSRSPSSPARPVTPGRSPLRPSSAGSPDRGRLQFQATEGADNFYQAKSTFDRASRKSENRSAEQERFGPTGFEKGINTPGPGSYAAKKSPKTPPRNSPGFAVPHFWYSKAEWHSSPGVNKPSSPSRNGRMSR